MEIERVDSTKFIGIYIDESLTWANHIKIIANKIAKNVGIIRKISHLLSTKILKSLYYTMINPYLFYSILFYSILFYSIPFTYLYMVPLAVKTNQWRPPVR